MPDVLLERDAAMASIQTALERGRGGKGHAVFLLGEAGLGKTSLLVHARRQADGFRQRLGRGSAIEAGLPFGILSQAIEVLEPSEQIRTARQPLDSRAIAFRSTLMALRSSGPILLALDDLHWADPDSLALLAVICRRISDLPIVVLGALRANPPAAINAVRQMAAVGDALVENLEPLSLYAATRLLETRIGGRIDDTTAHRAWQASGGNPLLLEHLARGLSTDGTLRLTLSGDQSPTGYGLLLSRFAGISTRAYEFARMASVLGVSFRPTEAAALCQFSERKAVLALEELLRAGLARSDSKEAAEFVHPLFRQLLYEEIPRTARSQYHAMAFRILARTGAALSEAATHARLAGLRGDTDAVAVLERAGQSAMGAGAFAKAREHYLAAVEIAGDQAPASLLLASGHAALVGGDLPAAQDACRRLLALPALPPEMDVSARRLLGRALMVAGRHDQAEAQLVAAEEIALGTDRSLAVEVLLDHAGGRWQSSGADAPLALLARAREMASDLSPTLRHRADMAWGFMALHMGDASGLAIVEAAARIAESDPVSDLGDMAWSWGALGMWILATRFTERFAESDRVFEISYRAARGAGMPSAEASLAISQVDELMRLGRVSEAADLVDRISELADVVPIIAPWHAIARAHVDFELGRKESSLVACDDAEKRGATYSGRLPIFWLWLGHIRGRLLLDAGRADEAATAYARVEELASLSHVLEPCVVPWIWSALEAHVAADRAGDAKRLLEKFDPIIATLPCRWPRAARAIGMARIAEQEGQLDRADASFRDAVMLLEDVPMPLARIEALIAFGRFLRIHRHPREARPQLAQALMLAERANASRLMRLAHEELRSAHGRRRGVHWTLTPQEVRVAQLASDGLSDKQIAQRLAISSKTVEAHLQSVYKKLHINSRRELIRHAESVSGPYLSISKETAFTTGGRSA